MTGAPHDFLPCLALNSFLLSVFAVSMFSLLAVSVDRCWAVCFPVTYHVRSTTTTKIIIAFCWIFGIFFGYLPTMGWNTKEFWNGKCDLRVIADFNYLLVGVGIALISSLSIIALYLIIYCVILKQVRAREPVVYNSYFFILFLGKKASIDRCEFTDRIKKAPLRDSSGKYPCNDRCHVHHSVDARKYQLVHHFNHRQSRFSPRHSGALNNFSAFERCNWPANICLSNEKYSRGS